jgi:hypothetical protein
MKINRSMFIKTLMVMIITIQYIGIHGQSVLAAAGGVDSKQNMTLEWTLGETFVESVTTGEKWYTWGFHQPMLTARAVSPNKGGYEVRIYPNPTQDLLKVFIKTPVEEDIKLTLVDVTGKTINTQWVPSGTREMEVRVKHLPEGMYMLSVTSTKGYRINSFKVIKL